MKKTVALFLAACMLMCGVCYAENGEQTSVIPVTVTIVHSVRNIDVTIPAAMPVSVVDGAVYTADNVTIINNSKSMDVEISSVRVESGEYSVGDYNNFSDDAEKTIAMVINGAATTGEGEIDLSSGYFRNIGAGSSLAIDYDAKVSDGADVKNMQAASVVFVLRAVG